MPETKAILGCIRGIDPPLLPAGAAETLRQYPDGVRIAFDDGGSARLAAGPTAAGTLEIIERLRSLGVPAYVDLDPTGERIVRLLIPLVSRVRRLLDATPEGVVVELEPSQARHLLPRTHPSFNDQVTRLRRARESQDWVAVAETDRHEIVEVRPWKAAAGPDRPPSLLDRFMPDPDIRDRHSVEVAAPAALTLETARHFDLQSLLLVRLLFRTRAWLLGSFSSAGGSSRLDLDSLRAMGWQVLDEAPGRHFIAGAACQPWMADAGFTPIAPDDFPSYARPDRVRIAWTLEAEALAANRCRLSTETRAAATDADARVKFRRYWRVFGMGIVLIRRVLLPAVRRKAERDWRRATQRALGRPDQAG